MRCYSNSIRGYLLLTFGISYYMKNKRQSIFSHYRKGDIFRRCKNCKRKTWHTYMDDLMIICMPSHIFSYRIDKRGRIRHVIHNYHSRYYAYRCQICENQIDLPKIPTNVFTITDRLKNMIKKQKAGES